MHHRILLLVVLLLGCGCEESVVQGPNATAVRALVRALRDPDRGVRYAAVMALGKAGRAHRFVGATLHSAHWCERQEAAWWLRQEGANALPALRAAYESGNADTRGAAVWALSGLAADAVPLLRQALQDDDLSVRTAALASIRRMDSTYAAALADVVLPFLQAPTPAIRLEAALTLAAIAPARAEPAVPILAHEAEARKRDADQAVLALLRLGDMAIEALGHLDSKWDKRLPWLRKQVAIEADRDRVRDRVPSSPRLAATVRDTPSVSQVASAKVALRTASVQRRLDAVRVLEHAPAHVAALAQATRDTERDVRLAAALALGRLGEGKALRPLLKDSNWRVQSAALRGLRNGDAQPEDIIPFLKHRVFDVARAAYEALLQLGPVAAQPLARAMSRPGDPPSFALLTYGERLFEAWGASAQQHLQGLGLSSYAERCNVKLSCLRAQIHWGPQDKQPSDHLLRALEHPRLSVVATAALALGQYRLSPALLQRLTHESARVRAYAAFAIGWRLGAIRGIDQVPFEMRLPVLGTKHLAATDFVGIEDLSDEEQVVLAKKGIWADDVDTALRCASLLECKDLNPIEAERVMEVLLPEGCRGRIIDADHMRWILSSDEVGAALLYIARTRATSRARWVLSGMHRNPRADNLPMLYWFQRTHEPESLVEFQQLWMPDAYSDRYLRMRAAFELNYDPGPSEDNILRAILHEADQSEADVLPQPWLWLVGRWTPGLEGDAGRLIRIAKRLKLPEDYDGRPPHAIPFVRALGRCADGSSWEYLQSLRESPYHALRFAALASLAQRGDQAALTTLQSASATSTDAFLLLTAALPDEAAHLQVRWLSDPVTAMHVRLGESLTQQAAPLGVDIPMRAFLGAEPALAAATIPLGKRFGIVAKSPLCRTKRSVGTLFEAYTQHVAARTVASNDEDEDETEDDQQVSHLFNEHLALFMAAAPQRTLAWLREQAWDAPGDTPEQTSARTQLLRLTDRASQTQLLAWARDNPKSVDFDLIAKHGGQDVDAFFVAASQDDRWDTDEVLDMLAVLRGLSKRFDGYGISSLPKAQQEVARAWIRTGQIRKYTAALDEALGPMPPADIWDQLIARASNYDAGARTDLWSELRAGRHGYTQNLHNSIGTLGADFSTLPHWVADLDSNCCRVSGGLEAEVFEDTLGGPSVYGTQDYGIGQPLSRRMRTWLALMGGCYVRSRAHTYGAAGWIAAPE